MPPAPRQVDAGGETVRRDPLRRRDDRLGIALAHAPQDGLEQMLCITAALVGLDALRRA